MSLRRTTADENWNCSWMILKAEVSILSGAERSRRTLTEALFGYAPLRSECFRSLERAISREER